MRLFITKYAILFVLSIIILLSFVKSSSAEPSSQGFAVKLIEENQVVRLNKELNDVKKLYESDKWSTHSISVSPHTAFISFIEETKSECNRDGIFIIKPFKSLVILDSLGEKVDCINDYDVDRYSWSPDGKQIAFLTFESCDCDYKYKCPTGAWVYDLRSSEISKINDRAQEINWAIFDSAVYLYNSGKVSRWNPITRQLEDTEYKDIYFSPDGLFYLSLWKDESRPIQLFKSNNNELCFDIKIYDRLLQHGQSTKPFSKEIGELWSSHDLKFPYGWIFNAGHLLLFTKMDETIETKGAGIIKTIKSKKINSIKNSIYDPERNRIIRQFDGAIGSWISAGNDLFFEKDGKFKVESYESVFKK